MGEGRRSAHRASGRRSLASVDQRFLKRLQEGDEEGHGLDAVGQLLMRAKAAFRRFLGEPPPKSTEEEKMDEMAAVIRTYRGLAEEEEIENVKHWVDRGAFDVAMSIIIVLNTIVIGLEVDYSNPKHREWYWIVLEAFFCLIFILEISFKVYYHTWKWIVTNIWNFVTFVVALFAFIDAAILHPAGVYGNLRLTSLFRVAGLVRLARLIRRYKSLEELRLVVQGLAESIQTLVWTVVLIAVFIYICAVLLTKQIGHNVEVYGDYRKLSGGWDHEEYFGTVGRSMYTLLQAMTLDSWSSRIARHTIANQWYMTVFWVVFLLISTFGIMNIVVSVIVELMLTASRNNEKRMKVREERSRRHELESIREIFMVSDTDTSGQLDLQEFINAVKQPEVQWRMRQLDLPLGDAAKLFAVIDDDGSRSLSITEFINGCMKLKGPAQSKELLSVQAHADKLALRMDVLADSLADSERMMGALDEITERISKRFGTAVVGSRRKIAHATGGAGPVKPEARDGAEKVQLSSGNRPILPAFPDLLR